MHVLQWITVKADSKDEAFSDVKNYLETLMSSNEYDTSTWYDWFVTGGGRWNENTDGYDDNDQSMVLSYETDPDLFEERILKSLELRKAEFDRYAEDVKPELLAKVISDYNPRERDYSYFSDLYPIKKIIDMAYGEWDFNSYFFDMSFDSTTPKYMFEDIDKGNKNWYAVPVDFHF